jgi:ATP-dependent exoDNAse (exonuclease V) alpha subunit
MQRGALGARALNGDLQNALNPNMADKIERFGSSFAPGDKVMQTENDYDREVFNGDLGRVLSCAASHAARFLKGGLRRRDTLESRFLRTHGTPCRTAGYDPQETFGMRTCHVSSQLLQHQISSL